MPLREIFDLASAVLRPGGAESVEKFQQAFRDFGGFPAVITTSSGRTAFRLLLESLQLEEGSEIIFPAYTFHPMPVVAAEHGLTPVFADVDPETWNIDPESIRERITDRTRVIVPTHLYGVPADMKAINDIAREDDLFVIEDCAHAFGATYQGRPVGNRGDAAIFTFAMSKNLPCWGGGAMVVRDPGLADRMRKVLKESLAPSNFAVLRRQLFNIISMFVTHPAIFPGTLYPVLKAADYFKSDFFDRRFLEEVVPPRWPGKRLAVSSEQGEEKGKRLAVSGERSAQKGESLGMIAMSSLQAATGLRQLRRFPELLEKQVKNARRLREKLAGCTDLRLQAEPPGSRSSFLYVRARVDNPPQTRRLLRRHGVDTKADDMRDCAALSIFPDRPSCPRAKYLGGHCIELPCSPYYSLARIDNIASRVEKALKRFHSER